jgi:RNA polymerase sigma-70 factor (ECF subfamily)
LVSNSNFRPQPNRVEGNRSQNAAKSHQQRSHNVMTMWPDSPETQELLNQVRHGEAGAVDRLLARHREAMRRMIDMRLDPAIAQRVDASDIVQDVFLEASRRLADYLRDPDMPFHLWLRHMARDHIIDAHRRHRQAQRRSVDKERPLQAPLADRSSVELIAQLVDRELTPATAAIRQEMEKRFQEAIALLSDDDREIILMRHFEQLSNQEAATALGLSEAAASMRYLRALRRLRATLAPDSHE